MNEIEADKDRGVMVKITAAVPHTTQNILSPLLDSLVQQTMPNNEYEIICVDDCSQDGTVSILKKYSEQYSNITVIEREKTREDRESRETKRYVLRTVNTFFLLIPMIM